MSADNWTACPACIKLADQEYEELERRVHTDYGKITVEEYSRLLMAVKKKPELDSTFREDYELGVDEDGLFMVKYRGRCTECRLSVTFDHTENIGLAIRFRGLEEN